MKRSIDWNSVYGFAASMLAAKLLLIYVLLTEAANPTTLICLSAFVFWILQNFLLGSPEPARTNRSWHSVYGFAASMLAADLLVIYVLATEAIDPITLICLVAFVSWLLLKRQRSA